MKKVLILSVLLSSLLGCAAKNTTVTNLPTGVTQAQVNSWTSAVNDLKEAQDLTHGGLTTVIGLNHQSPSIFPDGPAYAGALAAFGKAEQLETQAAVFLKTVPNNWSTSTTNQVADYSAQILLQLQTAQLQGAVGIKSPAAVTALSNTLTQVMNVIKLVQSLTGTPLARLEVFHVIYA